MILSFSFTSFWILLSYDFLFNRYLRLESDAAVVQVSKPLEELNLDEFLRCLPGQAYGSTTHSYGS